MPDKTEEKAPAEEETSDEPVVDERKSDDEPRVEGRAAEEEEEDLRPIADPEVAAQMAKARDMGITGDPDAPPGYFVDENHRPNPLDVGTVITTEYHGVSSYDVASYSGAIANAGADPFEGVEVPESPEPPPQMGATDYDPTLAPGVPTEEAVKAHNESMVAMQEAAIRTAPSGASEYDPSTPGGIAPSGTHVEESARSEADKSATPEGTSGDQDPKLAEARAKAEETVEAAEGTVAAVDEAQGADKAQGARKAAKAAAPASPAGTKDTALEADPKK
jgi:hypothetical protein